VIEGFRCFPSVPPGDYRDIALKLGHDRFLPNHFQIIIINYPIIDAI